MNKLKLGTSALMLLMSTHSIATDYVREISTNRDSSAGISVGVTPIPGGTYKDAYTYSSVVGESGCRGTVTWASLDNAVQCKSDVEVLLKHSKSVGISDSVKGDATYVGTGTATATCNNGVITISDQVCQPLGCKYEAIPDMFSAARLYEGNYYYASCIITEDVKRYSGEMAHGQVITFYDNISGMQSRLFNGGNYINYPTGSVKVKCDNGVASFVAIDNLSAGICDVSNCIIPENYNWDTSQSTPRRHQGEPSYEKILNGWRTGTYNNCKPANSVEIFAGAQHVIKDAENENNYIRLNCDPQTRNIFISEYVCN